MQMSLEEYAEQIGQIKAAASLGIRQSALSKAIKIGRKVTVTILDDGGVCAQELKSFPCQKKKNHPTEA